MNFGLIEALEKGLKEPAAELNRRLDKLTEAVDLLNELQQTTNRLLAVLVEQGQKPPATPKERQVRSQLQGEKRR